MKRVTLAYLVSRPAPATLPTTRLPFERHIFQVVAAVTLVRFEPDDDYHAVLSDGSRTMIAESPAVECASRATRLRRRQMARARAALHRCVKAVVTGVAFFDFPRGQTGGSHRTRSSLAVVTYAMPDVQVGETVYLPGARVARVLEVRWHEESAEPDAVRATLVVDASLSS